MLRRLDVEADEMSSFVQQKANKQWIWIAMEATTRQVIAFHVGDRSRRSATRLWAKIPQAYRQHATFYTDQYVVYAGVIPAAQHRAIRKLARKTNELVASFGNLSKLLKAWKKTARRAGTTSTAHRPANVAILRITVPYSGAKSRTFFSAHCSRLMR